MIDPELKYCPRCNDEYRAEIVSCAACNVALITGRQKLEMEAEAEARMNGRLGAITSDDDIVTLHRGSMGDIKHLQSLLADQRIGSLITGDSNSCGKGCCGPSSFYLQVRREDVHEALRVIGEEYERTTALAHHDLGCADAVFDENAAEAVCPACGFRFATTETTCPDCGLCFG